MKLLRLAACDFMVYKSYKISLKFVVPMCGINFKTQHLTSLLINHCVTIHPDIFLKSLPCENPHRIIHQLLSIYFLINDLILSNFIQTHHKDKGIWAKNNLLVLCDGVFDGFFKLFLCFHAVLTGYIQFFCKFQQGGLVHLLLVL